MKKLGRKEFISRAAIALVAIGMAPKSLVGTSTRRPGPPRQTRASIHDLGIIDLHCHPSLKMYLWDRKIWKRYGTSAGDNALTMQYTVDELKHGYVKGFLATHYLVEADLVNESDILKTVFSIVKFPFIRWLSSDLADKVEHKDPSNFTQINVMIDMLETQIHRANEKQKHVEFVIARGFSEFDHALRQGQIPIAHAIEGAHALGTRFPDPMNPEWYVRNLEALKARGVCLMSIGHIVANDIASPVEGISAHTKKVIKMDWTYNPRKDFPLSPIGEIVVQKMLDIGMIVDLTHSTPAVRKKVFELNRQRVADGKKMRPLTFTHAGAQEVFEKHDEICNRGAYYNYGFYDASDDEIDWICACNGTIGIIPENFWLVACDTHSGKEFKGKFKNGIEYIVKTVEYINGRTKTKNYDNISIGTDFDGLADAPKDLHKPSQLKGLIEAFQQKGISDDNIRKIMSGNALRLLREGWE